MANLMFLYDLGVIFAIISGILTSIGYLMQKKVVNGVPSDNQFFKTLIKNKLWLWGLIFNLGFSSIFFMIAQLWVGPALIPGLMASGLIVLAIGSVRSLGEKLKPDEIFGIILMITATALLGFSNLSINININMFDSGFITRTTLFTVVSFIFIIICHIFQSRKANWRAVLLSVESGAMLGISYFWIGPMMDILTNIFGSNYQLGFLIYLIIASVILVVTNALSIWFLQLAFQSGQVSNMVPIQQIPIQLMPIVYYFYIYALTANTTSYIFGACGIALMIYSTFLLAHRQVQIDALGSKKALKIIPKSEILAPEVIIEKNDNAFRLEISLSNDTINGNNGD